MPFFSEFYVIYVEEKQQHHWHYEPVKYHTVFRATFIGIFDTLDAAKTHAETFVQSYAEGVNHQTCTLNKTNEEELVCHRHNISYNKCYTCGCRHRSLQFCERCKEQQEYALIKDFYPKSMSHGDIVLNRFKWQRNMTSPILTEVFADDDCYPVLCMHIWEVQANTPLVSVSDINYVYGDFVSDTIRYKPHNSWLYCCYGTNVVDGSLMCECAIESTDCFAKLDVIFPFTQDLFMLMVKEEIEESCLMNKGMEHILHQCIYPYLADTESEPEEDEEEEDEHSRITDAELEDAEAVEDEADEVVDISTFHIQDDDEE